jgi:hypothetical protein
MHLVIFHYHLLPGGVTGVIDQMAAAISRFPGSVDSLEIVSGSAEGIEALQERWTVTVVPEIGYISRRRLADYAPVPATGKNAGEHGGGPIGQVAPQEVAEGAGVLADRVKAILLERWGGPDTIWWVHNPHLGKNPAFTRALVEIVQGQRGQKIVFHIHDFPECGRYANMRYLHQAGIANLYPVAADLAYVTINSRDRAYLQSAGISDARYLPNPVPTEPSRGPETRDPTETRHRIWNHFGRDFPRFAPDQTLLLYPVRTIRRKNVFEAALITTLLDRPTSLIVTLPGVSQPEKKYSQMVQHAFLDGTIPGMWGIGPSLSDAGVTFDDLQGAADGVISSSVQEGFGYQFIAPLLLGKPLIARRLDVVADVEPLYDGWPHAFYDQLRVPATSPSLSGPQALLRFRYTERIDRLGATLPGEVTAELYRTAEAMLAAPAIDFSFLLPHMQYAYLKDMAANPGFFQEVWSLNTDLLRRIEGDLNAADPDPAEGARLVEERFGLRHFARRVDEIIAGLIAPGTAPPLESGGSRAAGDPSGRTPGDAPGDYLLRAFATLDYQRLLYE